MPSPSMKLPSAAWTAETPTTTTLVSRLFPKDLFVLLVSVITYQGVLKPPNFELLATITLGDVGYGVESFKKCGSTYVPIRFQAPRLCRRFY